MTEARQKYRITKAEVNDINRILRLISDRRGDSVFKGDVNIEADLIVKDPDGNTIHSME
jgi:hypothetical protein